MSERVIVEAAAKLAASVRLENVSMRGLAQELGVPVMTIYNYVPNKDALHDLVVSSVLHDVRVPSPEEGTWEERLKQLERDARRALSEIPGLSLERGDSIEGARLADGVMSILASAGFSADEASLAFTTLFTFMVGQIDVDVEIAEGAGAVAAAIHGAAQETRMTPDEIYEFGFDAVIEGLKVKLHAGTSPRGGTRGRR